MKAETTETSTHSIDVYLAPVPTPPRVTSRGVVRRAIEFKEPPRIPYSFVEPAQSDFFEAIVLKRLPEYPGPKRPQREFGEVYYDEWGVGHRVTGRTWDQSFNHPLQNLRNLDSYEFPDLAAPELFAWMVPYIQRAKEAGKFIVAWDSNMIIERLRALLGFEEWMMAPRTQPERLEVLLDRLADLTVAIIQQWGKLGSVDAFMTWEDFGFQTALQMRIDTFRRFYKPRYARIVQAAHENGMCYIWHNCGQILDMLPDMIDIGVDVVQLDQPRLMGYQRLSDEFGGKICFWNTLDIQWSTRGGATSDDIRAEVADMVRAFDRFSGGFMARHYPQPEDIGLSRETLQVIYEAFLENGCAM
jgi:hypothetical protein